MPKTLRIALTDEAYEEVRGWAEDLGVSLSLYARSMILTGKPPTPGARPVAVSVFHDTGFVRKLADHQLRKLLTDRDPLTVKNARTELDRRDGISRGIYDAARIDPSIDQTTHPEHRPRRRYEPARRNPHKLPFHLQVNNPAAKELAKALAPLDDDALVRRTASPDPVLAEAAEKELARRKLGVRLYRHVSA